MVRRSSTIRRLKSSFYAPSRLQISDVACQAAFRLIKQAPKNKGGLFSKVE